MSQYEGRWADGVLGNEQSFCLSESRSRVHRAAADDGAEDARFGELGGGHLGEIVRKDDEIGVLALFQFTFLFSLELRAGRARGIRADAIVEADFLLRLPAVFRTAIRALARNAGLRPHIRPPPTTLGATGRARPDLHV